MGVLAFLLAASLAGSPSADPSPQVSTPTSASSPAPGAPAPTDVGPVRVTARSSKSEVTVGEAFTIELEAKGPEGTTYTFPPEAVTDAFELRTSAAAASPPGAGSAAPPGDVSTPGDDPRPGTRRYEGAVFTLGRAEVPPIPVRYRLADGTTGEALTEPLALRVVSLLPKGEEPALADVRPPVEVAIGRAFWVALALAAALLLALGHWLWRRRRRGLAVPAAAPSPPVPPDVEALRALDALEAQGLPARGEHRAYYIALTTVAKRYLERRLAAPVVEMTTAETLAFLRGHPQAGDLHPTVRDVAEAADRIKFARAEGLVAEAERHLQAVRSLVGTLEGRLTPPAEAETGRAA